MTRAERHAVKAVLRGRGLGGGSCEGEALVTGEAISGWGGVDPGTGTVIETRHELCGRSFAGKVLVFPGAKGSSGWSGMFHQAPRDTTIRSASLSSPAAHDAGRQAGPRPERRPPGIPATR